MTAAPEGPGPATLRSLVARLPEYWGAGGQKRFARDAGVSEALLSRLLNGKVREPGYFAACRVTALLEEKLGCRADPRQVFGGAAGGTPLVPPGHPGPEPDQAAARVAAHWRRRYGRELSEGQARIMVRQAQRVLEALAGDERER